MITTETLAAWTGRCESVCAMINNITPHDDETAHAFNELSALIRDLIPILAESGCDHDHS